MQSTDAVVIVGAGHSSARAAHALRSAGYCGRLSIIGEERHLPYDRPPLSKGVLTGTTTIEQCQLYDDDFYRQHHIEVTLSLRVDMINRHQRVVIDENGGRTPYTHLILATGAEPRRLIVRGSQLPGVRYLRTADDASGLREIAGRGSRIVVVGAGFIGLEVASSAVALGCRVTVVEMGDRALQRAVPAEIADRVVAEHIDHGVAFRFNAGIHEIVGQDHVEGVVLTDGTRIECDCVVVGIGAVPAVRLALASGLEVEDGICVDDSLQTTDPSIFAIGDACAFPSDLAGGRLRLESWKNAEDQARIVAAKIAGQPAPASSLPWFWSDQYDLTLQIVGLPLLGHTLIERDLGEGSSLLLALDRQGVPVGAGAFGSLKRIAREMRMAHSLVEQRAPLELSRLQDETESLRTLLAAT